MMLGGPDYCQHCGQLLPHHYRQGARLTALQTKIFDTIRDAGAAGISREDLRTAIFTERGVNGYSTLSAHIGTINHLIARSGAYISHAYRGEPYRLRRRA